MELRIKPNPKNTWPLKGLLIKGSHVKDWIYEIQSLGLEIKKCKIHPVPGITPNTIWGCFILCDEIFDARKAGKNELCQQISNNLFIPERSTISPLLSEIELEKLAHSIPILMHPEFGVAELSTVVDLAEITQTPTIHSYYVNKPVSPIFIPSRVRSLEVKPLSPEQILKNLEENVFPKHEKMEEKPLNIFEKSKLAVYSLLFNKASDKTKSADISTNKTGFWKTIEGAINSVFKNDGTWAERLQNDFENLEKRNQKQINKLMDLFRDNPEEALKYAIPLDENGSNRGGMKQEFNMSKRWGDLSLFGSRSSSGGGSIDLGDHYNDLRKQYLDTAQSFIEKKQYHKAAFVYMKLLKNPYQAAVTLEEGQIYTEAATIFMKIGNKTKAAECYEKGNMTHEAIEIYKELHKNEKVGDLYATINMRKEADLFYEKVVDHYCTNNQFVKAALIYRHKMNDANKGQSLLLDGWKKQRDGYNCLCNYFANIEEINLLKVEIDKLYQSEVSPSNSEVFLQAIQKEYKKQNAISDHLRELAYEIIASRLQENPSIVSEMRGFNKNDTELMKDTVRFKVGKNRIPK